MFMRMKMRFRLLVFLTLFVFAALSGTSAMAGLVAHWKLDDGTGITAVDSAGGHDGTRGPT